MFARKTEAEDGNIRPPVVEVWSVGCDLFECAHEVETDDLGAS